MKKGHRKEKRENLLAERTQGKKTVADIRPKNITGKDGGEEKKPIKRREKLHNSHENGGKRKRTKKNTGRANLAKTAKPQGHSP